jgi:hypothetical protein
VSIAKPIVEPLPCVACPPSIGLLTMKIEPLRP